MWYIYTMEYYSAIKKNEIMSFAVTWLDWWDYHTKWSKSNRERQIWCNIYVESQMQHKWTYLWNRNRFRDIGNRLVVAKEGGVGEGGFGV